MTLRMTLCALACAVVVVAGCGEDEEEAGESNTTMTSGDTCACPDGVCAQGECVLQVMIASECADQWGTANVFFNDLNGDPVGTVSVGEPYVACDPIAAPIKDADGAVVQEGEAFTFIVESEDTRQLSGSQGESTFQCEGSVPFVWTIECN